MTYFGAHCLMCNREWTIIMPYEDSVFRMKWDMWKNGGLIQNVFPELTAEQREGLKTGTCKSCWEKIFPKEKT
jgi:hypothetical protein